MAKHIYTPYPSIFELIYKNQPVRDPSEDQKIISKQMVAIVIW